MVKSAENQVDGTDPEWHHVDLFQIIQCQGCDKFSFREGFFEPERAEEFTGDTSGYDYDSEIYPARIPGRQRLHREYLLPSNVRDIYAETHSAICNKQPILAGIGIRALIETICNDKSTKEKDSLAKRIDELVTVNVLTPVGAEILHKLRILGNQAAHEVKPHSADTLSIAFDVVETIISNVYILPMIANGLPKSANAESDD